MMQSPKSPKSKGPKSPRYRPASEFDEATLARKREYWRTKKREQRAQLAALKRQRLREAGAVSRDRGPGEVAEDPLSSGEGHDGTTGAVDGCPPSPDAMQETCGRSHTEEQSGGTGPPGVKAQGSLSRTAGGWRPALRRPVVPQAAGETPSTPQGSGPATEKPLSAQQPVPGSHPPSGGVSRGPTDSRERQLMACQKERWFQRLKLNKVLPQFPRAGLDLGNDQRRSSMRTRPPKPLPKAQAASSPVHIAEGGSPQAEGQLGPISQPNGAQIDSFPEVPATRPPVRLAGPARRQTPTAAVLLNGGRVPVQPALGTQRRANLRPQPRASFLRRVPADVADGVKITLNVGSFLGQRSEWRGVGLAQAGAVGGPRPGAGGAARPVSPAFETEEEKVARRREYWRIKKREQRAKVTARARERMKKMGLGSRTVKTEGHLTHPTPEAPGCSASQVTTQGNPLTQDAQLASSSSGAATASISAPCTTAAVKPEPESSVSAAPVPPHAAKTLKRAAGARSRRSCTSAERTSPKAPVAVHFIAPPSKSPMLLCRPFAGQSGVHFIKRPGDARAVSPGPRTVASVELAKSAFWRQRLRDAGSGFAERWSAFRSKAQRQRLLEMQRVSGEGPTRGPPREGYLCPATATTTPPDTRSAQQLEEERMARRREYWRTKKREQRAKLSAEAKARMKERDAQLRRAKRYQCILGEMRRERARFDQTHQALAEAAAADGEAIIGGFIREDGTVTTDTPPAPSDGKIPAVPAAAGPDPARPNSPNSAKPAGPAGEVFNGQMQSGAPPPSFDTKVHVKEGRRLLLVTPVSPSARVGKTRILLHGTGQKGVLHPFPALPHSQVVLRSPLSVRAAHHRLALLKQRPAHTAPNPSGQKPASCKVEGTHLGTPAPGSAVALLPPSPAEECTDEERMARKREYWRIKKREQRAKRVAQSRRAALHWKRPERQNPAHVGPSTPDAACVAVLTALEPNEASPGFLPNAMHPLKQEESPPQNDVQAEKDVGPACGTSGLSFGAQHTPTDSVQVQPSLVLPVSDLKLQPDDVPDLAGDQTMPGSSPSPPQQLCPVEKETLPALPCLSVPAAGVGGGAVLLLESQQDAPGSDPESPRVRRWRLRLEGESEQSPSTQPPPLPPPPPPPPPPPITPRRPQRLRLAKRPDPCCSPEPPRTPRTQRSPGQLGGSGGREVEEVRQRKREYWRVTKQEQRARKAMREREIRWQQEQVEDPTARAVQGPHAFGVGSQSGLGYGPTLTTPPTTRKPRPSPLSLSRSLPKAQCARGTPPRENHTSPLPHLLPALGEPASETGRPPAEAPVMDAAPPDGPSLPPEGDSRPEHPTAALLHPGLTDHTDVQSSLAEPSHAVVGSGGRPEQAETPPVLPCLSVATVAGGGILLLESQQDAPGSDPDSPRVRRWRLTVQEESEQSPPAQPLAPLPPTPPRRPQRLRLAKSPDPCCSPEPPRPPRPRRSPGQPGGSGGGGGEEGEEEVRQRKREYWRVKKQEQRARKAVREREMRRQREQGANPTARAAQRQDLSHWYDRDNGAALSTSPETDPSIKAELCGSPPSLADGDCTDTEADPGGPSSPRPPSESGEGVAPSSQEEWRALFLMDFDPQNQLLVCMVCGELQHAHSLDGVRGHIADAHPDSLALSLQERAHILQAWDEQVYLRERFFSSQLQRQHAEPSTGGSEEPTAEIEVLVDQDELPASKSHRSPKSKSRSRDPHGRQRGGPAKRWRR
ncbi:serine/arginine repetitive matrix protein 2 [Amia ocellicauda]|uniref:serine/arginine repetitive matrix protein 2 n=1 Tax=Amia ocellicauda TaxID=2972642 RepID=UPI003464905E